jgi:hypothetical protein
MAVDMPTLALMPGKPVRRFPPKSLCDFHKQKSIGEGTSNDGEQVWRLQVDI